MNRKSRMILFVTTVILIMAVNAGAGEFTVKQGIKRFSDIGLEPVRTLKQDQGKGLTREFRLRLHNPESTPVYNLKARLIHTSDQVAIEDGEVWMGKIRSGETAAGPDTVSYRVDTAKTRLIPEIRLHWLIEYDDENGKHHVNEMLITEMIRTP